MTGIFLFLYVLWFLWMVKYILFWLYLWQLKDYHFARFVDHFRTHKGKKLIFDYVQIVKLILLVLFLGFNGLFAYLFYILILIYSGELVLFLKAILTKAFKKPVKTLKTVFLFIISFTVVILIFAWTLRLKSPFLPVLLLVVDILTPIIISAIVLLVQPFFVWLRKRTLKKAEDKMSQIRAVSGLKVIAITGSYGKTTTKEFLTTILSKKFNVLSTREHQNSEIGVANCILHDLKPHHQIFIAEVGAYDKGKVREVCNMIKPKIGIVTGVNEQHLALFGSMENLLSAEGGGELFDVLPKEGTLVVNGDNKYCLDLYKRAELQNKKIYSLTNKSIDSDIWAEDITVYKDKISFVAMNKNKEMLHFEANVLGKHSIQNLLGAILVARELGMSFGEISEACNNITQLQAGMTIQQSRHGIDIVDSSYSANPDGVFADLDYFSILPGKKIIVMPCLIELGEKSSAIHEKIGRKIAEICDVAIITSKDKFNEIKKGAISAGMMDKNILLCDKSQDIYSTVTFYCKAGDAVLLEGRVPAGLISLLK